MEVMTFNDFCKNNKFIHYVVWREFIIPSLQDFKTSFLIQEDLRRITSDKKVIRDLQEAFTTGVCVLFFAKYHKKALAYSIDYSLMYNLLDYPNKMIDDISIFYQVCENMKDADKDIIVNEINTKAFNRQVNLLHGFLWEDVLNRFNKTIIKEK